MSSTLKAADALRGLQTEAVIEALRDVPFNWDGASCIHLARAQAFALGHPVPRVPRFKSARGALRVLRRQGAGSVAELLDQWFERHPAPAFARIGDLVLLPGENARGERDDRLGAICIADGVGNLFGWHPGKPDGLAVIKWAQADAVAAWRL